MTSDPLGDALAEILDRSLDDVIQIWEAAGVLADHLDVPVNPGTDDPRVIDATVEVIRRLLEGRWMVIGDLIFGPGVPGFVRPWELSPIDAAERVRREWLALGRRITIADIAWLERTPAGEKRAREARNAET